MLKALFKIEYWYHVFIIIGAAGVLASLVFDFKGVANKDALLMFLGMFFVGIGEWINHPLQTQIIRPNAYTPGGGIITGHPRKNVALGTLCDILGSVLFLAGIYKIAHT